ncbi:MAG TPA: hypothetical protein VLX30_02515 [Burkholderiales bacterium]|nr:hypothetical protein [Burkholderiales bacterium]
MPLLGKAAMLLSFDIAQDAVDEHDDWHTHEHLPERLSIPGFLRGTRWAALRGRPGYLVLYEVADLATLASSAYLERLNNPTPWTRKMMPHYRAMARGLCSVAGSFGLGSGHFGLLARFRPVAGAGPRLREWLMQEVLPKLPARPGLGSVHLLIGAAAPQMTNEQRIRGADAKVDWALLATGYREGAVAALTETDLAASRLQDHGAEAVLGALYRCDYTLGEREVGA